MMNNRTSCNLFLKLITACFYFLGMAVPGFSQELPPVVKYKSQIYNAGNQDWMISQDAHNFMYFANNEGLLEFNGSTWALYPSPNETIIRAVKVIGDKIYTGCYMEFGYWERQTDGTLLYTSLSKNIKNQLIEDEHFWNILGLDDWVLFQSFNRIYVYHIKDKTFQTLDNHRYIFKSFKINNSIYFQAIGEGVYEIVNGKSVLVTDDERIKTNRIVDIYLQDDDLYFQTERAGVFKWHEHALTPHYFKSEKELSNNTIFSARKLSNGGFALGTISNGIYILDESGKIQYHITQNTGLSNNTVLSIFEDSDNNIWLGLDNGIDCINLQSPLKSYIDDEGYLGTVYASVLFEDKLYLGTNQGLFYKSFLSEEKFRFISGTKGQVWSLFTHDGQLFCGHDLGTFLVNDGSVQLIFKESGTWKFNPVPNHPDLLMQGNYSGLSILEKKGGQWQFRNKLQGYDISSRYFEIANNYTLYIGHEYKGIIRAVPTSDFTKIQNFTLLKTPEKGKHQSLVKYHGTIYFAGKQGIYRLNEKSDAFVKDENLSEVLSNNEYISGKLNVDDSGRMWLFTKNYIYYFTSGSLNKDLKKHKISIPFVITNPMMGYENITQISKDKYLVGKTDGYFIINFKDFEIKNHEVYITNINVNKLEKPNINLPIDKEKKLSYDQNNITFNYSVPQYNKFINVEYQYILEGFQNQWSEWSMKPTVSFKNLGPGYYVFKVRAKVSNEEPKNIATYKFEIKKPWYANTFAMSLYVLLSFLIAYFINRAYKNHYHKQREKLIEENNRLLEIKELENEQELMKLRNEQLSQDVDSKSKELAVSTMNLIKKDELLKLIQEDLKKTADTKDNDLKSVISKINRTIKDENSWDVFKEAYDNLDKDFLKNLKEKHPSLTPSDLKLCAYLRLNLSSKEIAPMLHISIRSVEIKRYRLRKKLNLDHDKSLVNYILEV